MDMRKWSDDLVPIMLDMMQDTSMMMRREVRLSFLSMRFCGDFQTLFVTIYY